MIDFGFAEPQRIHLLWLVGATVAGLIWLERRGGTTLGRFVSSPLQERLVSRPGRLRRTLQLLLLGLSALFLVLALMRPQWGGETLRSSRVGAEIMIALDVSKSMLAEDVAPNRLARAKAEIRDLLRFLDGNQVGLIAFAGRASVVAPLTPDFGFLRLVLDNVGPETVRRGGTRLEEPIRKAVAGFGDSGDLARILLLITDGEDHDSFPLDAAKVAAERGIRIIAVGFGDETGSEIHVTDPRTGARALLRDSDGRPVMSRLDGELLRELALATEGAYVPAGTGVLDLEAIFTAHISPLMQSSEEAEIRTVRNEGYQWAVLLGLLALLASVALLASGSSRVSTSAALVWLCVGLASAEPTHAQAVDPVGTPPTASAETTPPGDEQTGQAREQLMAPEDPREAYNQGLEALRASELDGAEHLFEAARSQAKVDGEARFRATYNLGWVDVERSDGVLQSDPESALASLERAADWFRAAVALRPKNEEARRNLEIVLQRIVVLADSLKTQQPRELEQRLEELIERQRALLEPLRALVNAVAHSDDPHSSDAMRPAFRSTEVEERAVLASAQQLAGLAAEELEALEGLPEEERTPEQSMRAAQLAGLLHYLHRARERIGQARSQLRQRQAERSYRRASGGLASLKRARDQLMDPVQVLDAVLSDASQHLGETRGLAAFESGLTGAGDGTPAWLSARYLVERQESLTQRTDELAARLRAGLEQGGAAQDPEQQALLQRVSEAEPLVAEGLARFQDVHRALEAERVLEALDPLARGIAALAQARERFFDLKRLIEAAYADQQRIDQTLNPRDDPESGRSAAAQLALLPEFAPVLTEVQTQNLSRVQRMRPLLDEQLAQVDAPLASDEGLDPDAILAAREQRRESLVLAGELAALTESAMEGARTKLPALAASADAADPARQSVAQALLGLENLRRIFFTIIEHLQDVARQQLELNDATADAITLAEAKPDSLAQRLGPVGARQQQLATRTEQLAMALHEQSLKDPAELVGDQQPLDDATAEKITERYIRASELVLSAGEEMSNAVGKLGEEPPPVEPIRELQDVAFENLVEALRLLQPPQPEQPQQPEQQEGEQQGEQDQQAQPEAGEEEPKEPDPNADPAQLLQQVRDREAERHRDRGQSGRHESEPVEKDW